MTQRYEVQTKFIYGFENVWRDENGKLIYFDTREQAIKELRENVDDWNNDPNTTSKYYYNDYRVRKIKRPIHLNTRSITKNSKRINHQAMTKKIPNLQAKKQQAQAKKTIQNRQAQAIDDPRITSAYLYVQPR